MCDRREQEREFREAFMRTWKACPGVPQTYLIPGPEGECHDSLVERFLFRIGVAFQESGDNCVLRAKHLAWEYEGTYDERVNRLALAAYEMLATGMSTAEVLEATPAMLRDALDADPGACVAIQYEIFTDRWNAETVRTIRKYAQFWAEARGAPDSKPVLLFLNIILPRRAENAGIIRLASPAFWREQRVRGGLDECVKLGAPIFRVRELPGVTRNDVSEWIRLNNIYALEKERMEALDRLFPDRDTHSPRPMSEIESFCINIVNRLAAERT